MARKPKKPIEVETLTHDEASRKNIPTAELQSLMRDDDRDPREARYRRNHDLDSISCKDIDCGVADRRFEHLG